MIQPLKVTDYPELYRLQQQAYRVEADLIGVTFFPPLLQTEAALREEHPSGYIMRLDGRLVGAVTVDGETITRLLVSPDYFRQGIATQLLRYACEKQLLRFVSTAALNEPAIALYRQFGFRPVHQVRQDAIVLVTLERDDVSNA
ncbi:ribosomal protein S18 acetylase RimI-like enzyme [Exiguobacterium sp. PvP048]|uniref:GNAT family N-acetyltransferase n=1 Tax=unclassified Exiguobacterium TaxID=2644629 RepID=UPI003393176F